MIKNYPEELLKMITEGTSSQRHFIFDDDLYLFGQYYFSEFFTFESPDFHGDFCDDFIKLESGVLDEAAWIAFAESAKTSWAKIGVIHAICYKKKRYINWDSYDSANSENALFDIANFLVTNPKLIADFGMLYTRKQKRDNEEEQKMKRIGNFITTNGVKCEAFSTQESTRGRIFKTIRPDMYVFDDFENSKTKLSYPVTQKVIDHINEAKRGLGPEGSILYLGNLISDDGSVNHIMEAVGANPKGIVRNIPVVDAKRNIAWPDKYVRTNKEATAINSGIADKYKRKVSLEAKREFLGDKVFETEMMNNPANSGDYFFNRKFVKDKMDKAIDPIKRIGNLKIWSEFNSKYRFGAGADTSEGKGLDSSAQTIINFTKVPAIVAATYDTNTLGPNLFAMDVKKNCELFGECILGVEKNGIGYATIATLLEIGYANLYQREVLNKISNKVMREFGFLMTAGIKYGLFSEFKTSFEDGELEIQDYDLLNEMYHFRLQDLSSMKMEEGMTRHYDKLMSAVIAWEMRKHSLASSEEKKKKFISQQPDYTP